MCGIVSVCSSVCVCHVHTKKSEDRPLLGVSSLLPLCWCRFSRFCYSAHSRLADLLASRQVCVHLPSCYRRAGIRDMYHRIYLFKMGFKDALVRVAAAMVQYHDQSNLGRRGFLFCFHISDHHLKESGRNSKRAGTWRQELVQRPWRRVASWLAPHGLLSLLFYRTQDHQPKVAPTTIGWTILH